MSNLYNQNFSRYPSFELKPGDAFYPDALANLDHESPKLYGIGDVSVLKTPLISIIGARKATPYGLACAQLAGRVSAECGLTVVSGGAIGCDSESQREALKAGGKIIVVPGSGPDVLYPHSSDKVFYGALASGGCVLTNIEWGMDPRPGTFISRNEIIAALSKCLIVCEAGIKSGTSSTAAIAAKLGKRIYSIPGSIFAPNSKGTNHLIEDGASIICDRESLETVIALDYGTVHLVCPKGQSAEADKLQAALIANPMSANEIAVFTKLDVASTFALIADYEAAGIIERQMDGRFALTSRALLQSG